MDSKSIFRPTWMHVSLLMLSTACLSTSQSTAADSPAWSASFVDREAMTAVGWSESTGNPLRAGTDASVRHEAGGQARALDPASGGSATPEPNGVVPASYNAAPRSGLQVRPYSPPTGILSGIMAGGSKSADPTTAAKTSGRIATAPSAAAAARTKGLVPQLLTSANERGLLPASAKPSAPPRAGSPRHMHVVTTPTARPSTHSAAGQLSQRQPSGQSNPPRQGATATQAAYRTASSAEAYQPPSSSGQSRIAPSGATTTPRPPQSLANRSPVRAAPLSQSQPAAAARSTAPLAGPGRGEAAAALVRAHELAGTAKTETDFSQVVQACQRVPARDATTEETAFGRELAAWALNRRGQLHAAAGRTREAMADFETATRLDSQRWRAFHNRGVLMAQSGQLEQAFDDFHRTIELNPQFAKAYSNRAALYVLAGELEPALRDYERAAQLDPALAIAHRGCGRTCHMLGRLNEALDHLDAALTLAPGDAAALTYRGDLLTDLGYYADAAADYDRALDANAKSVDACRSSAWLLATCPDDAVRNPQLALQRAEQAVRLERKADSVTYDTLAAAQASAGDFRQAMQSIRRAIELSPPSEKSVYQDRLQLYRQSTPFRIEPFDTVQQAGYQR